jgi:hypothetical protein
MDFLINAVADLLNALASVLPQWSFVHDIAADVETVAPYLRKANVLVPIDVAMVVLCLVIGLELVLVALYWIDRVINLIRGAG